MGACCSSQTDIRINKDDEIDILWCLNKKYEKEREILKNSILKANIVDITNLKDFLEKYKIDDKSCTIKIKFNKCFLVCLIEDAKKNSKLIDSIENIIRVFPYGKNDNNFTTGRKFCIPRDNFKIIRNSCLKELENKNIFKEYEKEDKLAKNPLSPTIPPKDPTNQNDSINRPIFGEKEQKNKTDDDSESNKDRTNHENSNPDPENGNRLKNFEVEEDKPEKPVIETTQKENPQIKAGLAVKKEIKQLEEEREDNPPMETKTRDQLNIKSALTRFTKTDTSLIIENDKPYDPLQKNKHLSILKEKPAKEICIQYIFIEILFNLFESAKGCSLEAKEDFLQFLDSIKNLETHLKQKKFNFVETDYNKLIESLQNIDFENNNTILEIYQESDFLKDLLNKSLNDCDYLSIFKMRFFLNCVFKFFMSKSLNNQKGNDENLLFSEEDIKVPKMDQNQKEIDLEKELKIYSKNAFYARYSFDLLNKFKGKFVLNSNLIFCSEGNEKNNLINSDKMDEDVQFIFEFKISSRKPNPINKSNIFESIKLENPSLNVSMNQSNDLSVMRNSVMNNNLNLNLFCSDFQKVYYLDYSKSNSDAAGGKGLSLKNKNISYLIRNNVFIKISDVVKNSINVEENKSAEPEESKDNKNNINIENKLDENKNKREFFKVSCEFQLFEDLPLEYKKNILYLRKKLYHIPTLDYENDYLYLFDILQGFDLNKKIIDIIENLIKEPNPTTEPTDDKKFFHAQNLYYLAEAYFRLDNIDKAIQYHEQGLYLKKSILKEDHPEYVLSLNNLSSLYFSKENYQEALKYYLECMEIEEKYLDDIDNPNLAITYNNIATVYNKINNHEEALKYYFKNFEIEKKCFGEKSLECAITLNNIGIVYDNMGDFVNASGYYKDSIKIREELRENFSPDEEADLGNCYNNLAVALDNEGKYKASLEYYNKSLEILIQLYDENHPDIINVRANIESIKEKELENEH